LGKKQNLATDIVIFCFSSVLLPHPEPSLLPHVCLAVFLLNILMHSTQSLY